MTTATQLPKMHIDYCEQGSPEWHIARRVCLTGSKASRLMGTNLSKAKLIAEFIAEEGTEQTKINRSTPEMERGTQEEPFALKEYEKRTGRKVTRVGICTSAKHPWVKYSPDGLIATKGKFTRGIEIKNPNSDTLIFDKMINEIGMEELGLGSWSKPTKNNPESTFKPSADESFLGIPSEYKWQVVDGFFVIEEMEELDFLLYDARFIEEDKRLYIVTVKRSDPLMQQALAEFEAELIEFRKNWLKWKEIVLPVSF